MSKHRIARRVFMGSVAVSAFSFAYIPRRAWGANERLHIASVGAGGKGAGEVRFTAAEGCNIVALCDVDERHASKTYAEYPKARKYKDFRVMLDERKEIDAVTVSTPDHTHAPPSIMAMKLGKHVFCQKPLTHSLHETRLMTETAAKMKVATQMGTQIHAGDNYRRVVEVIQSGAIGEVTEVHVWVGKAWGGGERPKGEQDPPATLSWDLWLGPAPERPYWPGRYQPGQWRRWWDFGTGTLGDMGCHLMDLPFWALKLRHPTSCEAEGPKVHPETCPLGLIVRYQFPARGDLPPVRFTWYDGNRAPREIAGDRAPDKGVMFIGSEGKMFANYDSYKLFPAEKFADYQPPEPTIPKSIGHHAEWIKACMDGSPTTCNFDYSGALTEAVLLGNVAFRTGKKLEWDAENLRAANAPEAEQYIRREYRAGWSL